MQFCDKEKLFVCVGENHKICHTYSVWMSHKHHNYALVLGIGGQCFMCHPVQVIHSRSVVTC